MNIIIEISYLVSSILFVFGIKRLASPKTARQGNMLAAIGMLIAIVVTLFDQHVLTYEWIIIGILIGGIIGVLMALKTPMTGMPQMVGLLNGFGGGASLFVAISGYYKMKNFVAMFFLGFILVACGKETLPKPIPYLKLQYPEPAYQMLLTVAGISLVLGILLVLPIGGADMPVAISLLNSYSGLAAAMTGFVLKNNELIIAGALVGASGIILTLIMCRGMNRSLMNVVMGGWENAGAVGPAASTTSPKGNVKSIDAEELAMLFDAAQNIIIVPGYGMAVAQAQHAVRELVNNLEAKGKQVPFAIHPVAGRMPGHMNVLLAEAQISYDKMLSMEDINDDFNNTDIALIIGANDVVNPAARHDKSSPIYGMPILNVDYSKTVIINKRSMNAGYAGIDNELFFYPNSLMYFGDAKEAVNKLVHELKNV